MKPIDGAVDDLKLSLGLLVRRMRSAAPPGLQELTWTQKAVIARLYNDGPATIAELARLEGVKPQSMGVAVAALEELRLIERKPHLTDGRQFNIELTSKGSEMRKTSKDASRTWLSQAITKLNKQEQAILFKAGEIIKHLVKQGE